VQARVTDDALTAELDTVAQEIDTAVESLRDLARGLLPPILDQAGVAAALRAHTRTMPVTVSVEAGELGRYHRSTESAIYFACLEAIQNSLRHGGPTLIGVDLAGDATEVRFTVADDGCGFDVTSIDGGTGLANIEDRLTALGGWLRVESAPGRGTRVSGALPTSR